MLWFTGHIHSPVFSVLTFRWKCGGRASKYSVHFITCFAIVSLFRYRNHWVIRHPYKLTLYAELIICRPDSDWWDCAKEKQCLPYKHILYYSSFCFWFPVNVVSREWLDCFIYILFITYCMMGGFNLTGMFCSYCCHCICGVWNCFLGTVKFSVAATVFTEHVVWGRKGFVLPKNNVSLD